MMMDRARIEEIAQTVTLDAEAMKTAAFAVFAKANEKNLSPEKIKSLWPSQHMLHWDGLAEAAVLAYLAGTGWQPIDTAPKDGTAILVWWPIVAIDPETYDLTTDQVGGARLVTEWNGGHWLEPECLNGLNSIAFDDDREYAEFPSLWRPLPTSPNQEQSQ